MNDRNSLYVQHVIARYLAAYNGFEGTADELDAIARTTPCPEDANDLYRIIKSADEWDEL